MVFVSFGFLISCDRGQQGSGKYSVTEKVIDGSEPEVLQPSHGESSVPDQILTPLFTGEGKDKVPRKPFSLQAVNKGGDLKASGLPVENFDGRTPQEREWLAVAREVFKRNGNEGSFVFSWYVRDLTEYTLNRIDGEKFNLSSQKTQEDKGQSVISALLFSNWLKQKDLTDGFFFQEIAGEKVLFLTNFVNIPPGVFQQEPDRVAVLNFPELPSVISDVETLNQQMRAQYNSPIFRQFQQMMKGNGEGEQEEPGEEEKLKDYHVQAGFALGGNFWSLIDYVHKKKSPLHVIGKCDSFCSFYLAPYSNEVYLEPFGEILFEGDTEIIPRAYRLFLKQDWKKYAAFRERISEAPLFYAEYLNEKFDGEVQNELYKAIEGQFGLSGSVLIDKIRSVVGEAGSFQDVPVNTVRNLVVNLSEDEKDFLGGFSLGRFGLGEREMKDLPAFKTLAGLSGFVNWPQIVDRMRHSFPADWSRIVDTVIKEEDPYLRNRLKGLSYVAGLLTHSNLLEEIKFPMDESRDLFMDRGKDSEYSHVSPSADALKELGINVVQGENTGLRNYILAYKSQSKISILALSREALDDCGFFSEETLSNSQLLTDCAGLR